MKVALCVLHPLYFVSAAVAEPMHFEVRETAGKCCSHWIQATAEITGDTPADFEAFLSSSEVYAKVVRPNSEGGSLREGLCWANYFGLAVSLPKSAQVN
jgi:hypothetical protein